MLLRIICGYKYLSLLSTCFYKRTSVLKVLETKINPFKGSIYQTTSVHNVSFLWNTKKSFPICWSCGSNVDAASSFCNNCKCIQYPDKRKSYFEVLGIEKSFEVNIAQMTTKYRELQKLFHPDKFSNKSEEEKRISEQYSSFVNKAYSTLMQPLSRGEYMLKLEGLSIEEGLTQLDPTFLMEIMERNEELENETDSNKLQQFSSKNQEYLDSLNRKVLADFKSNNLAEAKRHLTKMKYYSRIDTKLKTTKQRLGIPD